MRFSFVVHMLIGGAFAVATAITSRMVFLVPFWVGGILGVLIYSLILIGFRVDDRFD